MKLSGREKILLAILLILGIVITYYNFVYKPYQIAQQGLLKENRVLKSLIERDASAKAQNMDIEQEKTKVIKLGNELMLQLPSEPRVPETVAFLKKTAGDTHVNLKSVNSAMANQNKPSSNKNAQKNKDILEKVQLMDYNITVEGSYNNLLVFLLKFENAPRLYTINSCRMTANAKEFDQSADEVLPPIIEGQELAPGPLPLQSIPKGAAIYDGNSIQLDLKFSAYYEEEGIPGLNSGEDNIPSVSGKINPFL